MQQLDRLQEIVRPGQNLPSFKHVKVTVKVGVLIFFQGPNWWRKGSGRKLRYYNLSFEYNANTIISNILLSGWRTHHFEKHKEKPIPVNTADGETTVQVAATASETPEHLLWKPQHENWLDSAASLATPRALLGFSGYFQAVVNTVEHSHFSKTNYSPHTDSFHFLERSQARAKASCLRQRAASAAKCHGARRKDGVGSVLPVSGEPMMNPLVFVVMHHATCQQ